MHKLTVKKDMELMSDDFINLISVKPEVAINEVYLVLCEGEIQGIYSDYGSAQDYVNTLIPEIAQSIEIKKSDRIQFITNPT